MTRLSNVQPLNLCVYRYPDNLELKIQKKIRQMSTLASLSEPEPLRKMKIYGFSRFIPSEAPFVLGCIKVLINAIEKSSAATGKWGNNSVGIAYIPDIDSVARKILSSSISVGERITIKVIQERNLQFILALLREILKHFHPGLVHFLNTDILPVTSSPLYDTTMRPNPKFKSVVKHAVLRSSRTIIDTAAFVMIHLFHIWEYAMNMQDAKKEIVHNFGKLIVSFECTPKLIDKTDITPESCLLGIILETTNVPFWNSLTGHRVFEAFDLVSKAEKKTTRLIKKCQMFPEIPEIMKYDIPHLKMPINYFFKSKHDSYEKSIDLVSLSSMSTEDDITDS